MDGGKYNSPKKATGQTCYSYELNFEDIRGLPAQEKFPLNFPKH